MHRGGESQVGARDGSRRFKGGGGEREGALSAGVRKHKPEHGAGGSESVRNAVGGPDPLSRWPALVPAAACSAPHS